MTRPEPATVGALLDDLAIRREGDLALVAAGTGCELTFGELRARAAELAASLAGLGIPPGAPVAFLLDNGLLTAEVLLGTMYAGRVAVPLNPAAGEAALGHVLAQCDAGLVFVAPGHLDLCRAAIRRAARSPHVLVVDSTDGLRRNGMRASSSVLPPMTGDQEASLYYTSGTTGLPKGVVLSHAGLLSGAKALARAHQLTGDDRSYCVLPLYHLNALVATLLPSLLSGGSVVLARRFNPATFWHEAARHGCTWSGLVPTLVSRLLLSPPDDSAASPVRPPAMRFARCSSAPLETSQQRAFEERFGVPLIEAMGMTEAGATIFAQPLPPAVRKAGSVGRPVELEIKVTDAAGRELPVNCPGEILVRGASVMKGYHKDPRATAAALDPEGWLHTGDQGRRDSDGHFFITGRLKELVVKAGENIAPREIELALARHPAVLEAAAVGVPDPQLGQDLMAYVVLHPGAVVGLGELQRHCTGEVGAFKTPTEIHVVAELPRGPSGKLQRLRLARREAPTSSRATSVATPEQAIARSWAAALGVEGVAEDDDFFALGGDSLLATRVIACLREELNVDLPLSAIFEAPTVSQLSARIRQQRVAS